MAFAGRARRAGGRDHPVLRLAGARGAGCARRRRRPGPPQSGHTVDRRAAAPEQSNQRYFEYLDLLGRSDRSVDVLQIDVIWPSALADQLVDLTRACRRPTSSSQHFPAIVANNTVDGRLVAMPWFTDAGILYYRADLLAKYGTRGARDLVRARRCGAA